MPETTLNPTPVVAKGVEASKVGLWKLPDQSRAFALSGLAVVFEPVGGDQPGRVIVGRLDDRLQEGVGYHLLNDNRNVRS
jgi:hypothetical protein